MQSLRHHVNNWIPASVSKHPTNPNLYVYKTMHERCKYIVSKHGDAIDSRKYAIAMAGDEIEGEPVVTRYVEGYLTGGVITDKPIHKIKRFIPKMNEKNEPTEPTTIVWPEPTTWDELSPTLPSERMDRWSFRLKYNKGEQCTVHVFDGQIVNREGPESVDKLPWDRIDKKEFTVKGLCRDGVFHVHAVAYPEPPAALPTLVKINPKSIQLFLEPMLHDSDIAPESWSKHFDLFPSYDKTTLVGNCVAYPEYFGMKGKVTYVEELGFCFTT